MIFKLILMAALLAANGSLVFCAPSGARQAHLVRDGPSLYDLKLTCGRPGVRSLDNDNNQVLFKILNGTCAPYGSHPWMAQIQARYGSKFQHHCGGTILSEDIVITAAHCFQTVSFSNMRVVVGQGLLSSEDEEEMIFDVDDAIIHPRWDTPLDGRFSNDLALIKLRRKGHGGGIQFSDKVAPACLPPPDAAQKPGTECTIAGWGKTNAQGTQDTDCLRSANVPLIEKQECQKMYQSINRNIVKGMMCAGYSQGGVDACRADSGGPLTCKTDGKFYIHGIVSWGEGCGQPNRPGVYTNVKDYLKWIEHTINSW